jgi:predicted flap endonuclease-1-like 5' DNA nuclease
MAEVDDLRQQLDSARSEVDTLNAELEGSRNEASSLNARLGSVDGEHRQEVGQLNAELSNARSEIESLRSELTTAQSVSQSRSSELTVELSAARTEIESLRGQVARAGAENEELRSRLDSMEASRAAPLPSTTVDESFAASQEMPPGSMEPSDMTVADMTVADMTVADMTVADMPDEPQAGVIGQQEREDDLVIIEGIGAKIAELFNQNGIYTFARIAQMTLDDLNAILRAGGPRFQTANPESWAEQARLAANGEWDALEELQNRLQGGRLSS